MVTLQTLQVAAGGMHSVALTEAFQVYTTGVNDEGALGRFTGVPTCLLKQHTCIHVRFIRGLAAAASEVWKGHEGGKEAGDSYTWGHVDMPATHGHAVQISAGMRARVVTVVTDAAMCHEAGLSHHLSNLKCKHCVASIVGQGLPY